MSYPLWFQGITDDGPPQADDARRRRVSLVHNDAKSAGVVEETDPYTALVVRIQQNDDKAFGELVEATIDRALRVAYYIVGQSDTAQDIVQDAMIRLWERRASIDPKRPVLPYLLTIVRNRALDEMKARRVRDSHQDAVTYEITSAATSTDAAVLTNAFDEAMAALPERQRTAVRLRYQEQMSYAAVGEVLGLSVNATHQLVLRGVRALRRHLGIPI